MAEINRKMMGHGAGVRASFIPGTQAADRESVTQRVKGGPPLACARFNTQSTHKSMKEFQQRLVIQLLALLGDEKDFREPSIVQLFAELGVLMQTLGGGWM